MFQKLDPDDPQREQKMREFMSPQQVDQMVRQAIQVCWMSLPREKKNIDEVEKQLRRVVDRALRDLREDADQFGFGGNTP